MQAIPSGEIRRAEAAACPRSLRSSTAQSPLSGPVAILDGTQIDGDLFDKREIDGIAERVFIERRGTLKALLPAVKRIDIGRIHLAHHSAAWQSLDVCDAHS